MSRLQPPVGGCITSNRTQSRTDSVRGLSIPLTGHFVPPPGPGPRLPEEYPTAMGANHAERFRLS